MEDERTRVTFLGTAAAEQVPEIFCRCNFCTRARKIGGREIRTRSSLRIGERYQIDFGPDANWQMYRNRTDMYDIEHLFVTHTHSDHFQFEEIASKSLAVRGNGKPLHIYLSRPGKRYLDGIIHTFDSQIRQENELESFLKVYQLRALDYFGVYQIDEMKVETLRASHLAEGEGQYALNFLFTLPDRRRLLYAVDTGYYDEEVWDYLEHSTQPIEVLIMDCSFPTGGSLEERPFGHHTLKSFIATLSRMHEIGFIGDATDIYATHFNPHKSLPHEKLQGLLESGGYPVTAAYDGMAI